MYLILLIIQFINIIFATFLANKMSEISSILDEIDEKYK